MNQSINERLDAIYATLPSIACQRKCKGCCGPLMVPRIEYKRMESQVGWIPEQPNSMFSITSQPYYLPENHHKDEVFSMQPDEDLHCRLLIPQFGHCRVYAIRPLICRLWGLVKKMRCPWGCVPERWVSDVEANRLLTQVLEIQRETAANVR